MIDWQPRDPRIVVALRPKPYCVVGSTADQLRAVLALLGPVRRGQRYCAYTDWEVTWRYARAPSPLGHRILDARVEVSATVTFPRWQPPRSAPLGLLTEWHEYAASVDQHEQGHVELAIDAGHRVLQALLDLPWAPTAEDLQAAAQSTAERVLGEARRREHGYDVETRHGATQGVVFLRSAR